ncbi:MAG: helix-turn-helix domain-containing protein [Hormoscilla sp. GM102CHS1]|nr:helix-turn-helix domain-containing protein [Hormoscilla sp. GM102CHS1]
MPEQKELLEGIARRREAPHSLVRRTQIILKAAAGYNNKTISQDLGLCEDTVGLWRKRWIEGAHSLELLAGKSKELRVREAYRCWRTNPAPSALAYLVQNKCVKSLLWLVKRSRPI